jgi:hypothetical protein
MRKHLKVADYFDYFRKRSWLYCLNKNCFWMMEMFAQAFSIWNNGRKSMILFSAFTSESVECAINADCSMHLKIGDQWVMFVKRVVNRLGKIFRNPIEMSVWSKEEILDEIDRVNCRGLGDSLSCFISELAFTQYIAMVWHAVWPSTALVPSLTRCGEISQMSALQCHVRPSFRLTSPHLVFFRYRTVVHKTRAAYILSSEA